MSTSKWDTVTKVNEWTGATRTRHLRFFATADKRARVYAEVYQLNGRLYWTANIHVPFRSDLSHIAYGTYAATSGGMAAAKMRASRLALAAIRKAETLTLAA